MLDVETSPECAHPCECGYREAMRGCEEILGNRRPSNLSRAGLYCVRSPADCVCGGFQLLGYPEHQRAVSGVFGTGNSSRSGCCHPLECNRTLYLGEEFCCPRRKPVAL